jgi:hypothetical protein
MAKLASGAETSAPAPGRQVIEEKKTTTIDLSAEEINQPGRRGKRRKNPHINTWFASLAADERPQYSFSLYRDDPHIIIVEENLDDRASGKMLDKFTDDQIRNWPDGPFLQELSQWTKERYGGGRYHIMVAMRKGSTLMYNTGFDIEGDPILSTREQYRDGGMPMPGARGEAATFLPLIMKVIDEKLSAVTAGKQDGASALSDVMKAGMEANSRAFQWAMERTPRGADEETQLKTFQTIFGIAKEMLDKKEAAPAADPFEQVTKVVTLMKNLRELDPPPPPAPPAPTAIVPAEGPAMKDMIREAVAAAVSRKNGTDWGGVVMQVVMSPAGGSILTGLGNLAVAGAQWLRARATAPAPVAANQPAEVTVGRNGRVRGQVQPAQQPVPQVRRRDAAEPVQPAEPSPAQQQEVTEEMATSVISEYAIQRFLQLFEQDYPGNVAGDVLAMAFPALAVKMRFMTVDMAKIFIASNETLKKIKDDPRLPKFLEELMQYFKELNQPAPGA